jgi:RNA polymerase sigma factor FliA
MTTVLPKLKGPLDDEKRELIRQNLQLVKMIASKMAIFLPRHIDTEDLFHEGIVGLMDAALKFDQRLGMKFTTYATIRIKGSILDSLRSMDWIPRRIRKMSKEVDKVREDLQQRLKREPTMEEVSQNLNVPKGKLNQIMKAVEQSHMLSFEDLQHFCNNYFISEDKVTPLQHDGAMTDFERVEVKEQLKIALKELSDREKLILSLYYIEDLTLKEMKEVLGVSEARISQIHTTALRKLKNHINEVKTGRKARVQQNQETAGP